MSIESGSFNMLAPESHDAQAENIDARVVQEGVDRALLSVEERYEQAPAEIDNLPFHNVNHTKGVIRRTEAILSAIQKADPELVSTRDIAIGRLAGAYHDTVQRWEENKVVNGQFTKVLRRRFTEKNEAASTDEAILFMGEVNERGVRVFSDDDKIVVREAHNATIAVFDSVNGTMMQPKLMQESSLIARAVALADLGTAGMDGGEAFTSEGKALFKEENLDILLAIRSGQVSSKQKEYFKQRMVTWLRSQAGFVRGRQQRLETELQAIPEPARNAVANLFSTFEESITASEKVAGEAEAMTFEDLAEDMGY